MSNASSYIRHFINCNKLDAGRFVPFYIDDKKYGFIKKEIAAKLPASTNAIIPYKDGLSLANPIHSYDTRCEALQIATKWLATHYGKATRNELYPVIENWGDEPVAAIDRVAVPWFGARAWGVHINGYIKRADGIYLWIGKRAPDRPADPGKLDNLVGGGQPLGLTMEQNMCKEAKEEAGIEAPLALTAKYVRTLNYNLERNDGMRRDSLFIYDLELPLDFLPRNTDGEVSAFYLMSLEEVAQIVHTSDRFKFNCNLVIIDFLMRHGYITSQDKEYAELTKWLTHVK